MIVISIVKLLFVKHINRYDNNANGINTPTTMIVMTIATANNGNSNNNVHVDNE